VRRPVPEPLYAALRGCLLPSAVVLRRAHTVVGKRALLSGCQRVLCTVSLALISCRASCVCFCRCVGIRFLGRLFLLDEFGAATGACCPVRVHACVRACVRVCCANKVVLCQQLAPYVWGAHASYSDCAPYVLQCRCADRVGSKRLSWRILDQLRRADCF
jgi:hypothetical protein